MGPEWELKCAQRELEEIMSIKEEFISYQLIYLFIYAL